MEDKDIILDEQQESSKKEKKNRLQVKIEELEIKNKELKEKIKELEDKNLRTLADAENYKKRINQEKINDKKYAASNFASELLVPYEQLDKVVEFPTDNEILRNFLIGFKMIRDQFKDVLEREGVKEINSLNEKFDAYIHHAIEKESNKEKENGTVLEVMQKGYYFKDRILRPAMVKVNEWSDENGEDK